MRHASFQKLVSSRRSCSVFFFSSRRRHTRWPRDWNSDVCSSDLAAWAGDVLWKSPPGTAKPHLLLQRVTNKYGTEMWDNPEVLDIDVESGRTTQVARPNPVVSNWVADASGVVRMGSQRDRDSGKMRVLYRADAKENFRTILHETPDRYQDTELPDYILPGPNKAYALSNREGYRALY